MRNFNIDSGNSSASNASRSTNGVSISKPMAFVAGAVLFMMFTGLLITTTILIANTRSATQAQILTDERAAVQLQSAPHAVALFSTPKSEAEVTRSNAGISDGVDLGAARPPAEPAFDDVMERSFEAAIEEAAIAALHVAELERQFSLPACVAELQNLIKTVRIGFSTGSPEPLPQDMEGARQIATALEGCDTVMVAVEGHSDLTGQEQTNMQLSWVRADTVVNRLRAEGYDVSALEPLGFGARKPIDPATTAQANALNRRVQFHLAPRPGSDAEMFAEN